MTEHEEIKTEVLHLRNELLEMKQILQDLQSRPVLPVIEVQNPVFPIYPPSYPVYPYVYQPNDVRWNATNADSVTKETPA